MHQYNLLKERASTLYFCVLIAAIVVAAYAILHGLSPSPNIGQLFQITQDISQQQLSPKHHWLEQSFLYPVMFNLIGANYSVEWFFFSLTLNVIISFCGIAALFAFALPSRQALFLILLSLSSSAAITCLYWIGYADPFTLLFGAALVVAFSKQARSIGLLVAIFVLSLLAAGAHFPQAIIVLGLAFLTVEKLNARLCLKAAVALVGLLCGQQLLQLYFSLQDFQGMSRMDFLVTYEVIVSISTLVENRLEYLFSVFRFVWPAVILLFVYANASLTIRYLLAILTVLLFSSIALDNTRVASILAFPIVLNIGLYLHRWYPKQKHLIPVASALLALSIAVPAYHVWDGKNFNKPLSRYAYRLGQNILNDIQAQLEYARSHAPIPRDTAIKFDDPRLGFVGWSPPERRFRWSDGEASALYFHLEDEQGYSGVIKIHGRPLGTQELAIWLNGRALETVTLTADSGDIEILFPPKLLRLNQQKNMLEFEFSNPHAPSSQDKRLLAYSIKSLLVQ